MICIVFRADDPRLVTRSIPGGLPGACSRCELAVVVTPGTRRSWPDAALVCTQCLTPRERREASRPLPLTRLQWGEIFALFFSR